MKHFFKISILVSAVIMISLYSAISYSSNKSTEKNSGDSLNADESINYDSFLKDLMKRVKKDYVEEKTDKELAELAADGILSSLDPHSSYLNEDGLKEMQVQTKGEFGGLGIEIVMDHSLVKIIAPIEGTPADKVGIKSGDYISKVNGKSIIGLTLSDIVKKLRGKPDTKVDITILRKGEENPIEFSIIRQIIKIKAIRAERKDDMVYVKINSFSQQAYAGLVKESEKIIENIKRENLKGFILDLRNNPGGLLDQAVKISDLFLDSGNTIVSISGRNKADDKFYKDTTNQKLIPNIPMIILINEGSASASEIVAGALQDNKRAIILGEKSFGKGSVQSIIPLGDKQGAIKMTTALYYTPSGISIQAEGINPDIVVGEATIEKKEHKGSVRSEASLNGHLKSNINKALEDADKSKISDDIEGYNKDYQLARAIDLLRGISVYQKISK